MLAKSGGDIALVADEDDELRHPRSKSVALVGVADVLGRGEGGGAVGGERRQRRLVGDEDPDVVGVAGDECQRVDRAAAAREEVDRPAAGRRDHRVDVVGVLLRRRLGRGVVLRAPLDAPRVVGQDRPVREVGPRAWRSRRRPSASR